MTKKLCKSIHQRTDLGETLWVNTNLLVESAIPARALYQARKAARIPNAPPALLIPGLGPFASPMSQAMPRSKKVMSRVKKRRKNMTVDRMVHISRRNVKMNQPFIQVSMSDLVSMNSLEYSYHQEQSKRVLKIRCSDTTKRLNNFETTWSEDDTERDPEATVR